MAILIRCDNCKEDFPVTRSRSRYDAYAAEENSLTITVAGDSHVFDLCPSCAEGLLRKLVPPPAIERSIIL